MRVPEVQQVGTMGKKGDLSSIEFDVPVGHQVKLSEF